MTNQQLYLSIGIPTFTVILALLSALFQNNRLADQLARNVVEINATISRGSDKIDRLADRMDRLAEQQHKDTLMLMGEIVKLHERISAR